MPPWKSAAYEFVLVAWDAPLAHRLARKFSEGSAVAVGTAAEGFYLLPSTAQETLRPHLEAARRDMQP